MIDQQRTISILGSTGSIGVQTLDVVRSLGDKFQIAYLTVNKNIELLEKQALEFNPIGVVVRDEPYYQEFIKNTRFKGKILTGEQGVVEAATYSGNDILLSALVGFSGVLPTLAALEKGIDVALANKETLVAAGEIITRTALANKAKILAVDSEHSAILQSLVGENLEEIEKIILTASGGPFRNLPLDQFENITLAEALNHPNWSMGSKITIDSATMMNKGFEVIEAYWLFGTKIEQIEVVIHPQSIIHSLVQFVDGSVKAQLGLPDMRLPISYALTYPKRLAYDFPRMNLAEIGSFSFFSPVAERYPCLALAFDAVKEGALMPAVLNAANEIAVENFLNGKIRFTDISKIISAMMNQAETLPTASIEDIVATDKATRLKTENYIKSLIK